jgi:hypothetical protein
MKISPDGISITNRFFQAIETLRAQGEIRGLQTFTEMHGINRWNMNTVKFNPETSVLKPEWIFLLVSSFGVSADYIVTGRGKMFGNSNYVVKIDESQANLTISDIEKWIDHKCAVRYMPSERQKTAIGVLKTIRYANSDKAKPVVDLEDEKGKVRAIGVCSIISITEIEQ